MLRNCASINSYIDNESGINLLGWTNIVNISKESEIIPIGSTLAEIELNDNIFNYRKLLMISSDETIIESRINAMTRTNQIIEAVCSHMIPVPINNTLHNSFQFSFPLFDYTTINKEQIVQAVIIDGRHLRLTAGAQLRNYGNVDQEENGFVIYGLGKRNFISNDKKNSKSFCKYFTYFKHINNIFLYKLYKFIIGGENLKYA